MNWWTWILRLCMSHFFDLLFFFFLPLSFSSSPTCLVTKTTWPLQSLPEWMSERWRRFPKLRTKSTGRRWGIRWALQDFQEHCGASCCCSHTFLCFLVPDVSASAHGHPECYDSSLRALHQTQRLQRGLLVSQLVSFSIWIKGSDLRLYTLSQFKMLTSSLWRSPTGRAGLISQRSWRTGSAWAWEHRPAQTGSTSN